MVNYTVVAILARDDEAVLSALDGLSQKASDKSSRLIVVADLERVRSLCLSYSKALPFSAFAYDNPSLLAEMKNSEQLILLDAGKDVMGKSVGVMNNLPPRILYTYGDDLEYRDFLISEASPNILNRLIFTPDWVKIFPYPGKLEVTRENVIDLMITISSITQSENFNQSLPFALVGAEGQDVREDEILRIAKHLGLGVEVVHDSSKVFDKEYKAILSFDDLGFTDAMSIYYGLPFVCLNEKNNFLKGLKVAGYILKRSINS